MNSTKLPGSNHPIENLKRAAGPGCVPGVSYPQPRKKKKKLKMTLENNHLFNREIYILQIVGMFHCHSLVFLGGGVKDLVKPVEVGEILFQVIQI